MTYSLWRNSTLLGEIAVEYVTHSVNFVGGMFVPTSALTERGGLVQGRLPHPSEAVLFQEPFAPPPRPSRGHVPLTLMDGVGVPPERVLEVRDNNGVVVPTDFIMLRETADLTPEPGSQLFDACVARGVPFSPWMLAICFAAHGGNAA